MDSSLVRPYDIFAAIDRLRDNADTLGAEQRAQLKSTIALNAADPRAVSLLVDLSGDDWAHIYPPKAQEPPITTGQAIDTFLNKFGKTSPEEEALLEKLIFNPVPEYCGILAGAEKDENPTTATTVDDSDLAGLASLAADINSPAPDNPYTADNATTEVARPDNTAPRRPAQPPLSLELAKIFVKQGQFDRAYEIISKIVLNNPEKSVYFADQMRFLEKLIKIKQGRQAAKSAPKH